MIDDGWIKSRFHANSDGTYTVQSTQDVEPILDQNKALQNEAQKSDWGRHIASIPNIIIDKWSKESGVNLLALPKDEFARFIGRKLKDPDWRWLRTDQGGTGAFHAGHTVQ